MTNKTKKTSGTPSGQPPQSSALQILGAALPGNTSPAVEQTIRDNPSTESGLGFSFDGAKKVTDNRRRPAPKAAAAVPAQLPVHSGPLNFASNTVQGPASIVELSRALNVDNNGPQLMYEWVANNIDWEPGWGVYKGAVGAITDGVGNAFDQSLLLANLLRQAGFTANIVMGTIRLTEAQFQAWWGVNDIWGAQSYCGNLFIPVVTPPVWTGSNWYMDIKHVWVQWVSGPNTYIFDPSLKTYTRIAGRNDLATIMGYNPATFMTNAQSGATVTTDYVQNMNKANISNNLNTFSTNLATWIKANDPDAQIDDLIGGQSIVPVTIPLLQTSLPYQMPGDVPTVWTGDVPATFKPTLQIQFPNWSTPGVWDFTYVTTSDVLAAKRLTLFFDASRVPKLYLDGTLVATGLAQPVGTYTSVFFTVTHPAYAAANYPQTWQQWYQTNFQWWQGSIRATTGYLIGNAWGNLGRGQMDLHADKLAANEAAGGSATSEPVLGEKLAVTWCRWAGQASKVGDLVNRITKCKSVLSHQVGIVSYDPTSTPTYCGIDAGGVSGSSSNLNNDVTQTPINDTVIAMHGVAFEAVTLAQMTGNNPGVSSTTVIDKANTAGHRIYKGTNANWNTGSNVQATLVGNGYNSADMTNVYNAYIQWGNDVLIGAQPTETIGSWTGWAYWAFPSSGAFGIVNGAFKYGGDEGDLVLSEKKADRDGKYVDDPIGIWTGAFALETKDIEIGSQAYPYRISFGRNYNSKRQYSSGVLGRGWKHSHDITATVSSNGFYAMGEQYALPACATIAQLIVNVDIVADTTRPIAKITTMSLADAWWVDQMNSNAVVISSPADNQIFIKQPDGSYSPPVNFPHTLSLVSGLYSVKTPEGVKSNFNSAGKIASIVFPNGVTITYSYTGANLTTISNGLGRTLTLNYTAGKLTSVTDGTGRSVSYLQDANANLTQFTDANSKLTTYSYVVPGLMSAYFNPAFPSTAFATNTYDSLNRIKSQANARNQVTTYYLAGSRAFAIDPVGNKRTWYLNRFGSTLKSIDGLGNVVQTIYDGLNRPVQVIQPEGDKVLSTFDKNDKPLSLTYVAKPGSGLANIVKNFTYDSTWAKVKTIQDGNGNTTTNFYDLVTGNLLKVQRPTIAGQTPVVNVKYNNRGQVLSQVDETGIQTQMTYDATTEKMLSQLVNTNWMCTIGGTVTVGNVLTIVVHDAGLSGGLKNISYTVISGDTLAKIATGLANAFNADTALAALGIIAYANGAILSLSTSPGNTTTFTGTTSGGATATLAFAAGLNLTTSYGYDTVGNTTSVTNARSNQSTFVFDNLRRMTKKTDPTPFSYVTNWTYDDNGNLIQQDRQTGGVPAFQTYKWTFSAGNEKLTAVDPANNTTTWTFDGKDRVQTKTDAQSRQWQYGYDQNDRILTVTDPTAVVSETRTYSANGKLASVKDARNNVTLFSFDGFDRPNKTTYQDTTFEQNSSYDANGNVLTFVTRSGSTIVNTWDALNRLATKTPSGQPVVTNVYDLAGRLRQSSKPVVAGDPSSGAMQFIFDTAGRFYKEQYPDGKVVEHVLDNNGNRTKTTWPDGYYVNRTFDQLDRLANIKLNGSATNAVVVGYNQLSQRTSLTFSNGTSVAYTPQLNEDVTGITHTLVGSSVSFTYGYNNVHEPLTQTVSDSTYMWHPGPAGTITYGTADNVNKYPTVGGVSYSYNSNKCLTGDGVWTFGYDTENHLLTATKTGTSASFVYDPMHRQSQKTVGSVKSRFIYSDWDIIAQYDGTSGNLQNRYVFGERDDEPLVQVTSGGVLTFLHADKMGSVSAVSNASGAIANKNLYSPFGEIASLGGTIFGFTGQRFDPETNLVYFKHRYYSPKLGRFLQPDPVGYTDESFNLYTYVGNNPLTFTDPMGLQRCWIKGTGDDSANGVSADFDPDKFIEENLDMTQKQRDERYKNLTPEQKKQLKDYMDSDIPDRLQDVENKQAALDKLMVKPLKEQAQDAANKLMNGVQAPNMAVPPLH